MVGTLVRTGSFLVRSGRLQSRHGTKCLETISMGVAFGVVRPCHGKLFSVSRIIAHTIVYITYIRLLMAVMPVPGSDPYSYDYLY